MFLTINFDVLINAHFELSKRINFISEAKYVLFKSKIEEKIIWRENELSK